mgnify:CR=1 FL=1
MFAVPEKGWGGRASVWAGVDWAGPGRAGRGPGGARRSGAGGAGPSRVEAGLGLARPGRFLFVFYRGCFSWLLSLCFSIVGFLGLLSLPKIKKQIPPTFFRLCFQTLFQVARLRPPTYPVFTGNHLFWVFELVFLKYGRVCAIHFFCFSKKAYLV